MEVNSVLRVIHQSQELIEKSPKLATQLSRCEVIVEKARGLVRYEALGINVTNPLPTAIIAQYTAKRQELIVADLKRGLDQAAEKLTLPVTLSTKVNALTKVLSRVRTLPDGVRNTPPVQRIEEEILTLISRTRLASYVEEAEKAEFKGQKKKALDRYMEALYLLKQELANDPTTREQQQRIEAKVAELMDPASA